MGYLDNNLPPGVTDAMIEEQQRDPYEGTRYAERAYGLLAADDALRGVLHQISLHRRFGCAINHPVDCPWPERLCANANLEERTREILQKIEAELAGIDALISADEEERR